MILNNKELIERKENAKADDIKTSISVLRYITELEKALQDAEADAKKQAAIHLHEEAKLLEEINRLKANLSDDNRREMLLDFANYSESDKTSQTTDECVDNYLDSIIRTTRDLHKRNG